MATAKQTKQITPRVVGHHIEHNQSNGEIIKTTLAANVVHETLRLELTQGQNKMQICAKDWEFFKKQADDLLGKRRLLQSNDQ